jgi:hypothetical protein
LCHSRRPSPSWYVDGHLTLSQQVQGSTHCRVNVAFEPSGRRHWWWISDHGEIDLCPIDPRFPVDVYLTTDVRSIVFDFENDTRYIPAGLGVGKVWKETFLRRLRPAHTRTGSCEPPGWLATSVHTDATDRQETASLPCRRCVGRR